MIGSGGVVVHVDQFATEEQIDNGRLQNARLILFAADGDGACSYYLRALPEAVAAGSEGSFVSQRLQSSLLVVAADQPAGHGVLRSEVNARRVAAVANLYVDESRLSFHEFRKKVVLSLEESQRIGGEVIRFGPYTGQVATPLVGSG